MLIAFRTSWHSADQPAVFIESRVYFIQSFKTVSSPIEVTTSSAILANDYAFLLYSESYTQ